MKEDSPLVAAIKQEKAKWAKPIVYTPPVLVLNDRELAMFCPAFAAMWGYHKTKRRTLKPVTEPLERCAICGDWSHYLSYNTLDIIVKGQRYKLPVCHSCGSLMTRKLMRRMPTALFDEVMSEFLEGAVDAKPTATLGG